MYILQLGFYADHKTKLGKICFWLHLDSLREEIFVCVLDWPSKFLVILTKSSVEEVDIVTHKSTHVAGGRSLELSRCQVRLLRFDRRRLLHRFSCIRHLGGGVEVQLSFPGLWYYVLAVVLRSNSPSPACGTVLAVVLRFSSPSGL